MNNDEAISLIFTKLQNMQNNLTNTCTSITRIDTYITTKEQERDKATNFKLKVTGIILGIFSLGIAVVVKFI